MAFKISGSHVPIPFRPNHAMQRGVRRPRGPHSTPFTSVRALCVLILALSPCSAAVIDARFDVVDIDINYLPFYPPVYNTGALMTLTTDQPLFFHAGGCHRSSICSEPTVVRCCDPAQCDPVLFRRKPGAPADCACPSKPQFQCLDPQRPIVFGAGSSYQQDPLVNSIFFEVAINNSCRNVMFDANTLRGSWAINTGPSYLTADDLLGGSAYHIANAIGQNGITLCADPNDGVRAPCRVQERGAPFSRFSLSLVAKALIGDRTLTSLPGSAHPTLSHSTQRPSSRTAGRACAASCRAMAR